MKKNIYILNEFHYVKLNIINNIHFTRREIDIIACVFNGRSAKKSASILTLAPKTIETHLRNVMRKLGCHCREGIVDFIEKAGKAADVRTFYDLLFAQKALGDLLKNIAPQSTERASSCLIIYWKEHKSFFYLADQLKKHLALAGIKVKMEEKEIDQSLLSMISEPQQHPPNHTVCISSEDQVKELAANIKGITPQLKAFTFALASNQLNENISQSIEKNVCPIGNLEGYYHCLFFILHSLLKDSELEKQFFDFQKQLIIHQEVEEINSSNLTPNAPESLLNRATDLSQFFQFFKPKKSWVLYAAALGILPFCVIFMKNHAGGPQQNQFVRSEFVIPAETTLLKRSELIDKIDKSLKGKNGIQALALVGIGGAGKTVLARQYAAQNKNTLVFEVDAESIENIKKSFERLAHSLAKTEKEKKTLKSIDVIKNREEKDEEILQFVKEKTKEHKNWFLIYDNIVNFLDIQKYFPQDSEVWGDGKVIITTQNKNIQNHKNLNKIIQIGELSPDQKTELFSKIMKGEGDNHSLALPQNQHLKAFLENIPSFPLDVSVAAYYLKATNTSCSQYLKNLQQGGNNIANLQENILKETGDYLKTRFSIVTLSLQHLIKTDKVFSEFLLLISLLDSQNIPLEFLYKFKNNLNVDKFIFNLKKYSFVTKEERSFSSLFSCFSIHRDIQPIILDYLLTTMGKEALQRTLGEIAIALNHYLSQLIEKEDLLQMRSIISHGEKFLAQEILTKEETHESIRSYLGQMNTYLGDYKKAELLLSQALMNSRNNNEEHAFLQEAKVLTSLGINYKKREDYEKAKSYFKEALFLYDKASPRSPIGVALTSTYLGAVYKHLGDYQQAEFFLEQGLSIYKQHKTTHPSGVARALSYLGNISQKLGEHEKARKLFEESLEVCQKYFPENHIARIHALARLGSSEINLGHYDKAKELLIRSLQMYRQIFPDTNGVIIWVLSHLGNTHRLLGEYEQSREILEKSLRLQQERVQRDSHTTAWIQLSLAKTYKAMGNYAKAKDLLNNSLNTYEKKYGYTHNETANVLGELGHIHLLEGKISSAEKFLQDSYIILENSQHPDRHIASKRLSELELKKTKLEKRKGY